MAAPSRHFSKLAQSLRRNGCPTSLDTNPYKGFLWVKGKLLSSMLQNLTLRISGNPVWERAYLLLASFNISKGEIETITDRGQIACFYFSSYVTAEKKAISSVYRSVLAQVLHQCQSP
jgi:hypothetical protein